MKTLNGQFSAISWTSLLAIGSLLAPIAHAQYDNTSAKTVYYVSVPSIPQPPAAPVQTIGMRQERAYQATPKGALVLVRPGMGAAWVGIADSLNTMAALGSPEKVLAAGTVAPSIQRTSFGDNRALLVYQMRIQASDNAIDILQARSVQFSGDTQAELRVAMREVEIRRAQLERSMMVAEKTAPYNWNQTQSDLAEAYNRYAEAAARVERLTSS